MQKPKLILLGFFITTLLIVSSFSLIQTIDKVNHTIKNRKNSILYQWSQTYGGLEDDYARGIVETSDGSFVMAGSTRSSGAGDFDIWLVKTDASGKQMWSKTYGGIEPEWASAIIETNDGGLAVIGSTRSFDKGQTDYWLLKTDKNGDHLWNKTYGGVFFDVGHSLIQTNDGGFALVGETSSSGVAAIDLWLVKTNSQGEHQWNKTFGGLKDDGGRAIVQTVNSDFVITGYTWSAGAGGLDMWLVKTNSQGEHQWNKTFGGVNNDRPNSLVQSTDGGFAIVGETASFGASKLDMWLVKTNSQGEHQWNKTFGGIENDHANSLVQSADGGFALAGKTNSLGSEHLWLVKTDSEGISQWNQSYGQTDSDEAWGIVQMTGGDYVIAGQIGDFNFGDVDLWLLKTDIYSNLTSSEIIYQHIKDNPASLLAIIPIIMIVFIIYYIRKNNLNKEKKSDLYPVNE